MNRFIRAGTKRAGIVIAGGVLLVGSTVRAFPPAPHHTLFGMVRNELGEPINISSGQVILETPTGVAIRCPLAPSVQPGVNYRLEVPMDSGVANDLYQPTALRPFVQFKLKVKIGDTTYLPIEMMGDFSRIGRPAEETRLDLTLGEDADGDGLPDAWERAMIAKYGGTLESIKPEDDLDGDGISNKDEYLAGTYASDPADGFSLIIVDATDGRTELEFLAVRGRTYSVQASEDLNTWTPVPFRLSSSNASAALMDNYYATDVRKLRIEVPSPSETPQRYYKALVH